MSKPQERHASCHKLGDWTVQAINDDDGHLNIYVTNSESDQLYEVDGEPYPESTLHCRITTVEIEDHYKQGEE